VGLGEVDVDAQLPGEFVVLGHFLALVPGDGDDVPGPHSLGDGGHDVGAAPRGDLDVDGDSGDSFDEGGDRGSAALADDEVAFLTLLVLPDRLDLAFRWPSGSGYG
jgi:hypothetical protein